MIHSVIKIGTDVEIHNKMTLKVIAIQLKGIDDIDYRVCGFNDDNVYLDFWVNAFEITSKHKMESIINQCLK